VTTSSDGTKELTMDTEIMMISNWFTVNCSISNKQYVQMVPIKTYTVLQKKF
jgi:hypothetical protein